MARLVRLELRVLRQLALCFPFITMGSIFAQPISPNKAIIDRPSSEQLTIPEYTPKKHHPGFTLPPARPLRPTPGADSQAKIAVKEFRFSGNTVFADQILQGITAPYINRAITTSELEQLRHRLTQHYIAQGYINSGAILPKQIIKNGVIHFKIIEGELSEIRVSGTGWLRPNYVKNRLRLGAGPPLNERTLQERYQLLLTDPHIERMDGRLTPSLKPGQSILDVKVMPAKPYGLSLSVDNHRPPSTGAEQLRLDGWLRNASGFGDQINLSLGYGEDRLDIDSGIVVPINRYDTLLEFHYTMRRSSILEKPLDELSIDNHFRSFELTLLHPLYRTLAHRVNVGARLALRKSRNTLQNRRFSFSRGEEDGESKVTALRLSQEFIDNRSFQVVLFRSTFSVGLSSFDATWHGDSRPDGDYFAWLGQLQYARQIMDNGAQIRFRANMQLTDDPLLPLEQYALGGVYSVRGYRENELVRDQGYNLSVEFHYPLLGGWDADWIPGELKIAPFMDFGAAWNTGDSGNTDYLHGVGLGLIWSHRRFSAEVYYAHDLNTATTKFENDLQDTSLYFRLTAFLL